MKSQNKDKSQETKQKFDELEKNPIVLSEDYTKQMKEQAAIQILQVTLYVLFYQLKKQHWIVEGPDWKHVSVTLDGYAQTIQELAEELS